LLSSSSNILRNFIQEAKGIQQPQYAQVSWNNELLGFATTKKADGHTQKKERKFTLKNSIKYDSYSFFYYVVLFSAIF
jgi:hypothetical protein